MKIKRVKLNRLRNEEWFNFFTEFKTFVEATTPEALDIEALFAVFINLYIKADEALELIRKSSFTDLIVEKDRERDNAYRGLSESVHTATRHYDPDKRAAAERLIVLFDHYGNIADRSYNEETAAIYNFLQDLNGKYVNEVLALDLAGWAEELDRTNREFEQAILDRKDSDLNMLNIRKQTDRNYLDIIERIEALCLVNGESAYADFIHMLNADIERYITSINRRSSNNKAKSGDAGKTESSEAGND